MLKKLLISAVTGAMLSIAPLSNAVADCGCGGFTLGLSGGMTFASSDFKSSGMVDDSPLSADKFEFDTGYDIAGYFGWEFFSDAIIGIEVGYKDASFLPKKSTINSPHIDTEVLYGALRADKFIALENNFDILFGAYAGIANVDLSGSVNAFDAVDADDAHAFSGDFNNFILGLRAGVAYNFTDNAALSINYLLTVLPSVKDEPVQTDAAKSVHFSDFEYITHGVELGLKWSLGAY